MQLNFIIMGAMKCGTTTLAQFLGSHPEIELSRRKETNFFQSESHFAQGLDWYESLFGKGRRYRFEASPNYTKRHIFPGVPERMHATLPDVKLIYILRDPVERVVSHYLHGRDAGREKREFSTAIRDEGYVLTSHYYFQLEAFLKFYSRDQILLVDSESLWDDPIPHASAMLEFAGIDSTGASEIFTPYLRKLRPAGARANRPTLNDEDRQFLKEHIAPDVAKLRAYSGLPFDRWSL